MDDRFFSSGPISTTHAGVTVTPDLALRVSTVYAAVNLLSKVIASVDCIMQRYDPIADTWTSWPQHPIADLLLYQPNPWQTAFDFKAQMMHHLVMRGNCYAQILDGPRGAVDSLIPIHPDRVRVIRLSDGTLAYDCDDPISGIKGRLLPDEIFHVRSPVSPNGLIGIGPLSFASQTIGIAMASEEHGARMFSNGARSSGVIEVAKSMSDEAFERFKEQVRENNSGLRNSSKTMILEDGATFKPIQMTADDMQFLQTRAFTVEEICRWFDVPSVLVHHTDKSTSFGTGIESTMLAFVRNNLMPWIVAWQQAIRRDLITAKPAFRALFDVQYLLRGDSAAVSNFLQKMVFTGILTRNDGRKMLGYNPLDGLDTPLIPVTQAAPNEKPVPGESSQPEPENPESNPETDPGTPPAPATPAPAAPPPKPPPAKPPAKPARTGKGATQ